MPSAGTKLFMFEIRRVDATENEIKTVAAGDIFDAAKALATWSPGVTIIKLVTVTVPGQGGKS